MWMGGWFACNVTFCLLKGTGLGQQKKGFGSLIKVRIRM